MIYKYLLRTASGGHFLVSRRQQKKKVSKKESDMLAVYVNGMLVTDFNYKPYLFASFAEAERFIRMIRRPNHVYCIQIYED